MLDRSNPRHAHPDQTNPRCVRASRSAFTLAELLIVIAIIGVLIAILLPTLAAARRSANAVKCLSALKQIGTAFQQYAQENNRAFPVVYWNPDAASMPLIKNTTVSPNTAQAKSWQDFLVKYLHKKDPTTITIGGVLAADIGQYKDAASVLWGCPNNTPDAFYSNTALPAGTPAAGAVEQNCFNSGYGMSRYAIAPYYVSATVYGDRPPVFPTGKPANLAMIDKDARTAGSATQGQFFKMEQWAKNGANKLLVADSNTFDIFTASSSMTLSALSCQPFKPYTAASRVDVDGIRHLSPNSSVVKARGQKGVNILYVDGHAGNATAYEAWEAIRRPQQ